MIFWKKLPNDIQNQILLTLEHSTIIYLYENGISLSDKFINLYKEFYCKNDEKYELFLYNYIELDRFIYWIKTNNISIINFLYKKMDQVKYKAILLFFSFLYSTEEFIDYIINNFPIINSTPVHKKEYYGIELVAIKLRNNYYIKDIYLLDLICNLFFNNNQFIRSKLFNYRSNSKINISYFYWVDKAYKNLKKNRRDLIYIEEFENNEEN